MPPRTIDNLGMDVSTRYAEDQKLLDRQFIKETHSIPLQTEIDVTSPFYPSELEALLQTAKAQTVWASFFTPERFQEQKRRLFTFQLIPSLGSDEKQESQAQKILAKLRSLAERRKEKQDQETGREERWLEAKEEEEEEKEKTILIALFDTIVLLDKFLVDINSRRGQYHKG